MDMITRLYDFLHKENINVHMIGQLDGICTKPTVILKDMGKYANSNYYSNGAGGYGIVHLLIYAPVGSYKGLIEYVAKVKEKMADFGYELKYTGNDTPIIEEDDIKALSTSVEYKYMKSI